MIGILNNLFARASETTHGRDELPRWVVIAIVGWAEAEVMRSKLESAAIPVLLQREAAGAAFGITFGPMGEVRVLVPEERADQATTLLDEQLDYEDASDDEIDEPTPPTLS